MSQQDFPKIYEFINRYGLGKDYGEESKNLAELIRERCPQADRLLDVATGAGLRLERMMQLFKHVEGAEASPAFRTAAQTRLPGVPIHQAAMRSLNLDGRFDAVTLMSAAIAYTQSVEALHEAVQRLAAHLRPGGVLLLEPWIGPADMPPDGMVEHVAAEAQGVTMVRMVHAARNGVTVTKRMHYLIADVPGGIRSFEEKHTMTLFADSEYEQAMTSAGLRDVQWSPGWRADRRRLTAVLA